MVEVADETLQNLGSVRRWRTAWPPAYEQLLAELRERWPEGRGVREFISILKLHSEHPRKSVEQAVRNAVELGASHLDGVRLCLRQLLEEGQTLPSLTLTDRPMLANVGQQPVNLQQYDQLLGGR